MKYDSIERCIGNTPMVELNKIYTGPNTIYAKLEGDNPAGSVKDRPAISMIRRAEERGEIKPGDQLIEATSGNTGIALAMAATLRGYPLRLIMPENMSAERRATMKAFGAEIVLVSEEKSMEGARDLADEMERAGEGKVLNQFSNPDNPRAHYETTAQEIWHDTGHRLTHFVSSMGTTGTIMGCSQYFKEVNPDIRIVGVEPSEGSRIPGIRKWEPEYIPEIFDKAAVDRMIEVSQTQAEEMMRKLGRKEGLFCGVSSGGAVHATLRLAEELTDALIVVIICDRGDRYISTGVFPS